MTSRSLRPLRCSIVSVAIGAITWLLAPLAASAQTICSDLETIATCRIRLGKQLTQTTTTAEQTTKAASEAKKNTETGLLDLATGLSSSVKDFLPLLQLSGLIGAVGPADKDGVIAVAINAPDDLQLKALINTKPTIFEPIRLQLPKEGRDAIEKDLLAVPNRQHVTLQLAYNLSTTKFGRDFGKHKGLLDGLFARLIGDTSKTGVSTADQLALEAKLDALARDDNNKIDVSENATRMYQIPATSKMTADERRRAIERALADVAAGQLALERVFADDVKASNIGLFGQMVLNQPQVSFTYSLVSRDELFGPEQNIARVSVELSPGNGVNSFLNFAGERCDDKTSASCAQAYREFTKRPSRKAAIKGGGRFAAFAQFTFNDPYAYRDETRAIDVSFKKSQRVSVGADYGRLIGVDDDGTAAARIDFALAGEWSSDETLAKNRFIASVTLTKKVGEVSVPFGIRYASHSEFLGDFDKGVTAHVGLKFSLFPSSK